ncbi:hypothetical protein ABW636_21145 [Aquimarina sp. 2201CG1-2-11]|uniref:hypothetical protein n=1 Tax=Aquimarina discodermiae TaxID=3231043 RepID=UPI003461FAC0
MRSFLVALFGIMSFLSFGQKNNSSQFFWSTNQQINNDTEKKYVSLDNVAIDINDFKNKTFIDMKSFYPNGYNIDVSFSVPLEKKSWFYDPLSLDNPYPFYPSNYTLDNRITS